ncbi:MAG: DUF1501 domain-containing protein [Myxococcales bacterium]|nr:DUF1501 domain-containing protein [Myxococcales bacterium]
MRPTRRQMILGALGAAAIPMLRPGSSRPARAAGTPPTKLLAIWLDGGVNWEHIFTPLSSAGIAQHILPPEGGNHPFGYSAEMVKNFDGSDPDLDAPTRKLRGPIGWNPADPADTSGSNALSGGSQIYRPWGYSWANPAYAIYDRACLLVGADQGTASHASGIVASMCGVAGSTFRAPSVQAVVAHHLASQFPDRPIPNAVLGGTRPSAAGLPALANPYSLTSLALVESTISDRRDGAWNGLRTRLDTEVTDFDGELLEETWPLTTTDRGLIPALRSLGGTSTSGTDQLLRQAYDTYGGLSRTIASDVLGKLEGTVGFEHITQDPLYSDPAFSTACIGYADTCGPLGSCGPYDFALRLLKSDLVTSLTLRATSIANFSFDVHFSGGARAQTSHLRIALEAIGQLLIEMSLTPASSGAGSLLDETLVYIYSDFGRTFARSPEDGTDHHPATCALLVGGNVVGNQMLGGYDESMSGSPLGAPVAIVEESGETTTRPPTSQDIAATVIRSFGLVPGDDFFIPGGYGEYAGALEAT